MRWPIVGVAALVEHAAGLVLTHCRPVLLEGALGVGKTVLAGLVARQAELEGWRVEACAATAPGRAIPFGAFSRFLPATPSGDLAVTLELAHRRVRRAADSRPLLLLVDDMSHLDPGSLALLHRLIHAGDVAVLLTSRVGEPLDASIMALLQDGLIERVMVPPLDRMNHDTLLAAVLDEETAARIADRLWEVTEGNPLFMREFVSHFVQQEAARSPADSLAGSLGGTLEEELAPTPLLSDIVHARVSAVSEDARNALELIALAAPIRLEILLRMADLDALAELEVRNLARVTDLDGQSHVIPDHPTYGETIRAALPPLRRLQLAGRLADTLMADGPSEPGEALQAVRWLLEADRQPLCELAIRAAAEALAKSDAALAERVVRSINGPLEVEATVMLGTALSVQGRTDEARAELDEAFSRASNDPERTAAALVLSRHRTWMERDLEAGIALLTGTIDEVNDPAARAELRTELAICWAVAGDARATIRGTTQVLAEPAASPRVTLSALVYSTLARTILGQYEDLWTELDRADALEPELRAELPLALDQLGVTRAMALQFVDLNAAASLAADGWQRATDEGGGAAIWSNVLAIIELERGRLSTTVEVARRGLSEAQVFDPFHAGHGMLSILSTAHALRGEIGESEEYANRAGPLESMEARTRAHADRALVWRLAADPERAARVAVASGAQAVSASHVTWGSLLYHDAVRLGCPELAVEPLARLAHETTAPLVDVMARHADAASAHDAHGLLGVAGEFLAAGWALFAAEAYAEAGGHDLDEIARARALAIAAHLASSCDGASTPLLRDLTSPLTARERDVAQLATEGMANPEIAERLVLSVRTVENHLAAVYRKLGLAGRHELAGVLPPAPIATASGVAPSGELGR